jgi:hypothetical protein
MFYGGYFTCSILEILYMYVNVDNVTTKYREGVSTVSQKRGHTFGGHYTFRKCAISESTAYHKSTQKYMVWFFEKFVIIVL